MRRPLALLLMLAVLLCGLHVGESGHAHAGELAAEAPAATEAATRDHAHEGGEREGKVAHAGHHHCPLAPEAAGGPFIETPPGAAAVHPAGPPVSLASLTRAPPLHPPAA